MALVHISNIRAKGLEKLAKGYRSSHWAVLGNVTTGKETENTIATIFSYLNIKKRHVLFLFTVIMN